MSEKARLDADKRAKPKTKIIQFVPEGELVAPYKPAQDPVYEDENGKRTRLKEEA